MIYTILTNKVTDDEINNYRKYLYDIFHMYFIVKKKLNSVELKSFPFKTDYRFIKGENCDVKKYIEETEILENIIIINSCELKLDLKKFDKIIYQCKLQEKSAVLYEKNQFGFGFKATESEYYLYKSRKKDILDKIKDSYIRRK